MERTSDLGLQDTLTVTVSNSGPSTIQNAEVNIFLPVQSEEVTGTRFFLYPIFLSSEVSE